MTVEALGSEPVDGEPARKYLVHHTQPDPADVDDVDRRRRLSAADRSTGEARRQAPRAHDPLFALQRSDDPDRPRRSSRRAVRDTLAGGARAGTMRRAWPMRSPTSPSSTSRLRPATRSRPPPATCAPAAAASRCGCRTAAIRYIQGNPDHPVNQGVLCAKGSAGIMQHYSPARLRKPLLRVGERGSGEFREIEWDEALELATALAGADPRTQSRRTRLLHRPRPVAGADRLVGAAVRHDQLRRARRLLLGEHGRRRAVHARRQLLGIRRAGLGARAAT